MFCVFLPDGPKEDTAGSGLKDQQVLSIWGQCQLFQHSVETLRSQLQEKGEGAELVWDKVRKNKPVGGWYSDGTIDPKLDKYDLQHKNSLKAKL